MIEENKIIYLDNNATTMIDPEVLQAMMPYFGENYSNPSSIYSFGRITANAIAVAREQIRDFVNAKSDKEIIATVKAVIESAYI